MGYLNRFYGVCCAVLFSVAASAEQHISIQEIHQQFEEGTLTSEALVKQYLKRIAQYDEGKGKINSVSQINTNALQQAQALDAYFKKHGKKGPMHGIPVLLKDNIDTTYGMSNSAGSIALKQHFPQDNAFLVNQLENAGAVILGKTNLSEWANFRSTASSSGWSSLYGQTKNAHDVTRSPCGSSSGSGAAIAAHFATVAVGTETDGSVTCPSAVNGIVGIKPTLGTISRDGIIPIAHSQDTAGPMARTVSDAVILLAAMTAKDDNDADTVVSNIDYMAHLKVDGLQGKRIGVVRNLMGYHKALDSVFEQAIADLKAQGAIVVDNLSFDEKNNWGGPEYEVLLYEFKDGLNKYLSQTKAGLPKSLEEVMVFNQQNAQKTMPFFGQEIMKMAQAKGNLTSPDYVMALKSAKEAAADKGIDKLLKDHELDLLIAPTTGPAWKIDKITGDHYLGAASSAAAISGYPHITVPMGFVHHLPVGLSMFSGFLQEGVLIEAAYSYEQATLHRKAPKL